MEKKENKLGIVDRRIVQHLYAKKPADFIAETIGRPVDLVQACIDEFLNADVSRQSYEQLRVEKAKAKQLLQEIRKAAKKETIKKIKVKKKVAVRLKKVNKEIERKQRGKIRSNPMPAKFKPKEKVFKTRHQNLKDKVSVRIDHKTIIYVDPGADIEAIKLRYRKRDPTFLKPENPVKHVKKFK